MPITKKEPLARWLKATEEAGSYIPKWRLPLGVRLLIRLMSGIVSYF